jgi:hypothetical protein
MSEFANAPQTITELRADRECDGSKWTPRDALISVLRDIDSGKAKVDTVFIAYREMDGDKCFSRFTTAFPDTVHTALGVVEMAKAKVLLEALS